MIAAGSPFGRNRATADDHYGSSDAHRGVHRRDERILRDRRQRRQRWLSRRVSAGHRIKN
jgi:hypothetical protein